MQAMITRTAVMWAGLPEGLIMPVATATNPICYFTKSTLTEALIHLRTLDGMLDEEMIPTRTNDRQIIR